MQNNTDKLDNSQRNKADKGEDEGNGKRQKTEESNPHDAAGKSDAAGENTSSSEKNKEDQHLSSDKGDAGSLKSQMKGSDADYDAGSEDLKQMDS